MSTTTNKPIFILDEYAQVDWKDLSSQPELNPENKQLIVNYPVKYQHDTLLTQLASSQHHINNIDSVIQRHKPQGLLQPLKKIKNIIAISANKGGVGKSTLATNIACTLAQTGCKTGLLDGDLYGPNCPHLLGTQAKANIDHEQYQPINIHGISTMSMGFLIDEKTPLVWRGPMASAYFQNMVFKTNWPDLDYLVIDLPPGTGDILLTLSQKVPISGVILVTTPQCLSVKDCQKGIGMLKKMDLPILGYIENMASFTCTHCQRTSHVFPKNTVSKMMDHEKIHCLGQIPLDPQLADSATPFVVTSPSSTLAQIIQQISIKACAKLACRPLAQRNLFTSSKSQDLTRS